MPRFRQSFCEDVGKEPAWESSDADVPIPIFCAARDHEGVEELLHPSLKCIAMQCAAMMCVDLESGSGAKGKQHDHELAGLLRAVHHAG